MKMLSYNLFRYMVFRNAAEGITVTAIIILIGMPGTHVSIISRRDRPHLV